MKVVEIVLSIAIEDGSGCNFSMPKKLFRGRTAQLIELKPQGHVRPGLGTSYSSSVAAGLRFSGIKVQSATLSGLDELSYEICHAFATVSSDPEIPVLSFLLDLTVIFRIYISDNGCHAFGRGVFRM